MRDEEIEDYLEKIKDEEIEVYLRKIKDILTGLRGGASCASGPCQLSDHVYIGKIQSFLCVTNVHFVGPLIAHVLDFS